MAGTKKLFAALTRRGPHRVLRGDLAFAGLSGVVYTPESGMNLAGCGVRSRLARRGGPLPRDPGTPGVLGHRRRGTGHRDRSRAVGPQPGLRPGHHPRHHRGVRLGPGKISVHPTKLGVAGHGFGGSAAVFAAAGMPAKLKAAVRDLSDSHQTAGAAARGGVPVPGLVADRAG